MRNFLYILGPLYLSGWDNNEIRYSLRSLGAAFPVDWLGISGPEVPSFLTGVHHIKVECNPLLDKYHNQQRQMLEACLHKGTPEELVLMNDDFIIQPCPFWNWQTTCRGPIPPSDTTHKWRRSLEDTRVWLIDRGIEEPICFEGHTPMPFLKSKAIPILAELLGSEKPLQFRSAYGNLTGVKGCLTSNAKRKDPGKWSKDLPFWSLRGNVSEPAKKFLRETYPNPSRWEV